MSRHKIRSILAGALAFLGAAAFSGCTVINSVSEGVGSTLQGVSAVTSSTTPDSESTAFVETRFASIRAEASRGEGEHLDSLAKLLGETDRAGFARFMKEHYAQLFTGLERPRDLLARIDLHRGRPTRAGT